MKKKVNKRKRRIIGHLLRASDAIEWDMWKHKGWFAIKYGADKGALPENEAQRELMAAIAKIKEAIETVKKFHGLTHLPKS